MRHHGTKTDCNCERPLLMDETPLGMGVNCLKCGRSAEHHLPADERRRIRDAQRRRRRQEVIEP